MRDFTTEPAMNDEQASEAAGSDQEARRVEVTAVK
jgi:hypothetical protein